MPPVQVLRPSEVVKTFQKPGWSIARQRGSDIILTNPGHIATLSVPEHAEVARGTLRGLIAKTELTVEQFVEALNR